MVPLISVITPSLNADRYLAESIRSVASQRHTRVEHIVVDGGSTDKTCDILRRSRTIRWISEAGLAQAAAINRGLEMATGSVIGWLNSDDMYHPEALSLVARFFAENPDADVVYGGMQFVDERGRLIRPVPNTPFDPGMLFHYGCYIPSTATFWKRGVIDDGLRLSEDFRVAMDWEWFLRLHLSGYRFRFLNRNLASFRLRPDSVSALHRTTEQIERERIRELYGHRFDNQGMVPFGATGRWHWYRLKRVVLKAIQGPMLES